MELYLVRHAIAEPRKDGLRDEDRALTRAGKRKALKAFRGLERLSKIDHVFSSPLVRAWETAKILADTMDAERPRVLAALAPGGEPQGVLERLRREPPEARIALVGHEPGLGELATWLVARSGSGLELTKAGAIRLDLGSTLEAGRARLVWLMPSSVLRRLAR
jgi:phosphohistidine phosphatase